MHTWTDLGRDRFAILEDDFTKIRKGGDSMKLEFVEEFSGLVALQKYLQYLVELETFAHAGAELADWPFRPDLGNRFILSIVSTATSLFNFFFHVHRPQGFKSPSRWPILERQPQIRRSTT